MKEKEKEYKVAGESVYKSDLSRRALKRLNKKLVNRFIGASPKEKEEIAGAWILTKKSLATILQIELDEKEVTETVIKEILFNPNLNAVNEKIWKRLSESENDGIRRISAMSKMATGKRLVEMLDRELEGKCNKDVVETIISNENISSTELAKIQSNFGSAVFYDKKTLKTALKVALAKQRLAQGTIMTVPGPKMYFQGDDNAEVGHFKFFREFSGEREYRKNHPEVVEGIIREKGYDTFIDSALPDSVIDRINPSGTFKDIQTQMITFNQDLVKLIKQNPALQSGDISARFKEHDKLVHIHRLTKGDNDIVVFKNFADIFYDGNYSSLGFPKEGEWVEILNSDDLKYGGGGKTNEGKVFSDTKQNFNLAANSIIIMKRVK